MFSNTKKLCQKHTEVFESFIKKLFNDINIINFYHTELILVYGMNLWTSRSEKQNYIKTLAEFHTVMSIFRLENGIKKMTF